MRVMRERLLGLSVALIAGCGSSGTATTGSGGRGGAGTGTGGSKTSLTYKTTIAGKVNNKLDLLFMIDNSPSTSAMQQKFLAQLPTFMQVLESLPGGLPDIHIGVVSSDMGAPGDSTAALGCTSQGDKGAFYSKPEGTCTNTTLSANSTFISDVGGQPNFTDPIDHVLQCISLLGSGGCGFEQPLASVVRALGADGAGAPSQNANFLRPDAYLGIVLFTKEDDCSAPANTTIFSLNGAPQSISNPDGPIARYRCAGGPRGAHVCQDPATGAMIVPPLNVPAGVTGNPPILNLQNCMDNGTVSSALTPVDTFVQEIKALKADPDNQIVVAAITGPVTPYAVEWLPPPSTTTGTAGQLWPNVMDSCGMAGSATLNPNATQTTSDGSSGAPAVRITQFVQAFKNGMFASICNASYATALSAIASQIGTSLAQARCIAIGTIQADSQGQPKCTVTNHLTDNSGTTTDVPVANCNENGGSAPCWTLGSDPSCAPGSFVFHLAADAASMNAASLNSTLECSLCGPGVTPGC